MSDERRPRTIDDFTRDANVGIIGIGAPASWRADNVEWVPSEGYDAHFDGRWDKGNGHVWQVRASREEMLSLAAAMAERWQQWAAFVRTLPDSAFDPPPEEPSR